MCHAYQILKRGGLKDENIVVMMYDDIAKSELNPRKGIIINHPQGQDVYAGVPKVIYKVHLLVPKIKFKCSITIYTRIIYNTYKL